jgi:MarR family transcriptional regulator for hemolysin
MDYSGSAGNVGPYANAELQQLAGEMGHLVQRLFMAEQSVFTREAGRYGLTLPQFVTLSTIERFGDGCERMGVIAREARQCSASMTGIIDRLEHMGLVQRRDDSSDRRSKLVQLTDDGRFRLEDVRLARRQRLERILRDMPPESRDQVCHVLERCASLIENSLES